MSIKYKGLDIQNIYQSGNTYTFQKYNFLGNPIPFEKNFPIGYKIGNNDLSDLAVSPYVEITPANSGTTGIKLDSYTNLGYKHISIYGYSAGGGGGGKGGKGQYGSNCNAGAGGKKTNGGNGNNGGSGQYFAISKYPLPPTSNNINVIVGAGGIAGQNGNPAPCYSLNNGKGNDGNTGGDGGRTTISIGNTIIINANGGTGGQRGNGGTSQDNGKTDNDPTRGNNGIVDTIPTSYIVYPLSNTTSNTSSNTSSSMNNQVIYAPPPQNDVYGVAGNIANPGADGYVRIYFHYQ